MFGIDIYSLETLVPSVVGVVAIISAMAWAYTKIYHLVNDDSAAAEREVASQAAHNKH